MVVESKKNGEILQWDDILLHTFPIILKDIYMIRYLLKAENQHFLSDSHHSCQAIPFSKVYFSLNPFRIPIFFKRPTFTDLLAKKYQCSIDLGLDHLQLTLLNWDTERVLALNKTLKVN